MKLSKTHPFYFVFLMNGRSKSLVSFSKKAFLRATLSVVK